MSAMIGTLPGLQAGVAGGGATGPLLRERNLVIAVTAFWIVVGAVSWILEYAISFGSPEGPMTLGRAAARWVYAALWWVATLMGIWLSDTFTVWHGRQYPRIIFQVVAGALIAVAWSVSAYHINLAIIPGWRPEGVAKMINTTSLTTWFFYTGLVCLMHAVIYAREYRMRQIKALQAAQLSTEAQLHALKMELQPHFLFNALNSVSALMNRDVRAANEMLVLIAEMLQGALERARTQEVTLAEEIGALRLYLQIEQIRFRDRLTVEWEIEPDTLDVRVPHMLLQPIIENSVKHGIQARAGPGRIEIKARRRGTWLELHVKDNGRGLSGPNPTRGFGIGLSNVRERLLQLYGERQTFTLTNAPEGGAWVQIFLPFIRSGSDAEDRLQEEP